MTEVRHIDASLKPMTHHRHGLWQLFFIYLLLAGGGALGAEPPSVDVSAVEHAGDGWL